MKRGDSKVRVGTAVSAVRRAQLGGFCLCGAGALAREMPAADIKQQILKKSTCQG
jgi:hypothetical protein